MIVITYSRIKWEWKKEKYFRYLSMLPHEMQKNILTYQDQSDRQSRIIGKLLILKQLEHFGLTNTSLDAVKKDVLNKPSFDGMHFSTAYSNGFIICAASLEIKMGIDIEWIKAIDLNIMKDLFTKKEWQSLQEKSKGTDYFYHLWTRKEAALKATGKGVFQDFNTIDVLKNNFTEGSEIYFFNEIVLDKDFKISLVTDQQISLKKENIFEFDFF